MVDCDFYHCNKIEGGDGVKTTLQTLLGFLYPHLENHCFRGNTKVALVVFLLN